MSGVHCYERSWLLNAVRYGVEATVVRQSGITVSMRVTLPLAEQQRLSEFLESGKNASAVLDYAGFEFGFMPSSAIGSPPAPGLPVSRCLGSSVPCSCTLTAGS